MQVGCRRAGWYSIRHIGTTPPADAQLVAPTLEDGYLLLIGDAAVANATEKGAA